jgi:hypothetical protein
MTLNSRHVSDSLEQREVETAVLSLVQLEVGCSLVEETLPLGDGVLVKVDGINREHRVLCEVYSHIGRLKGSQPDKLAADMLKLVLVERALGGNWRKLICLADADAAKYVQGKSWLAAAVRQMGFKVVVVKLPSTTRERILEAQRRQVMVNPILGDS